MAVVALGIQSPASAISKVPCKTVTTKLVDRPDGGNNGNWALDTVTRVVTICETTTSPLSVDSKSIADSKYHAKVHDSGTFTTIQSKSPQAGVKLLAGTKGVMYGDYTADFTAEAGFINFQGKWNNWTIVGDATQSASTSDWVKAVWGGKDFNGSSINNDWSWTYKTCSEQWVDWFKTSGSKPSDGDITGKPCSSVSPSASVKPPIPNSPSPTSSAVGGSLPTTGAPTMLIGAVGAGVLLGGAGLWYAARRRRVQFKA